MKDRYAFRPMLTELSLMGGRLYKDRLIFVVYYEEYIEITF